MVAGHLANNRKNDSQLRWEGSQVWEEVDQEFSLDVLNMKCSLGSICVSRPQYSGISNKSNLSVG